MNRNPFVSSEVEKRCSASRKVGFSTSLEANDDHFSPSATRLAGLAGVLFGWAPEAFWRATPAELAALFAALAPEAEVPLGAGALARLKERFPDG